MIPSHILSSFSLPSSPNTHMVPVYTVEVPLSRCSVTPSPPLPTPLLSPGYKGQSHPESNLASTIIVKCSFRLLIGERIVVITGEMKWRPKNSVTVASINIGTH